MSWNNVVVFLLGFVACAVLFFGLGSGLEVPSTVSGFGVLSSGFDKEISPSDHVGEDDIIVLDNKVILNIRGVSLSNYADSGSMVPVLDKGANGIRIVPLSEDEVEVGDIVSFRIGGILVVHRVIEKGVDDEGVWFDVKGDANMIGDGRIRFEDIEYVTVGILY